MFAKFKGKFKKPAAPAEPGATAGDAPAATATAAAAAPAPAEPAATTEPGATAGDAPAATAEPGGGFFGEPKQEPTPKKKGFFSKLTDVAKNVAKNAIEKITTAPATAAGSQPDTVTVIAGSKLVSATGSQQPDTAEGSTPDGDSGDHEDNAVAGAVAGAAPEAESILSAKVMKWVSFGLLVICALMGLAFLIAAIVRMVKKRKFNKYSISLCPVPYGERTRAQRLEEEQGKCVVNSFLTPAS